MRLQEEMFDVPIPQSDIVFTPDKVARGIVEWLKPSGICLDPCRGDGAFFRCLPTGAEWCEIRDGRDFFAWTKPVDWIIGNPPYSIFEDWLGHSFELAPNVAYIVPTNKIFQRQVIMRMITEWGGIKAMRVYGSGSVVGFPFGFSVGTFYFQKDYRGQCELILGDFLTSGSPRG
jgi:hypothetical protein